MPSSGRRNKKQKLCNPLKVRCQREVCFNTVSSDGHFLSPKKSLEMLQSRRHDVQVMLAKEKCENLEKENEVLGLEIQICKSYMKKEAMRMARAREASTHRKGKLGTVLESLPHLSYEDLTTVRMAADALWIEKTAAMDVEDSYQHSSCNTLSSSSPSSNTSSTAVLNNEQPSTCAASSPIADDDDSTRRPASPAKSLWMRILSPW
jgi:hypothetical protein